LDKKKELEFNIIKMKLNRNDDAELRKKILKMSQEERQKLGINKSTIWHIKKNVFEGKIPRIYKKILTRLK
jgi:hypothetical protein